MWNLMYPKGYKPRSNGHRSSSSSTSTKRCGACRTRIGGAKLLNGQNIKLNYCEKHYCKMPTSAGTICTAQNNGRTQYCDPHIRCHATGDEGRCWRFVKEENPTKFKYCKDHGCAHAACTTRRTDPSNPHCAAHRCGDPSCDKPKQVDTGSSYCERHTCLSASCTAKVPGDAAAAATATHFCDLHRTCAAQGCIRRCHTRDNLVPTKWCGAHYCTASDQCEERRAEGSDRFCRDHICGEPGCGGGKVGGGGGVSGSDGGHFCLDHTCKTEACRVRRERGAEYCGAHLCRVEDCVRPAAANRRCDHHRRCAVEQCKEWVYIEHGPDGEIKWPECENHHRPRCAATTFANTPCDNRILPLPANNTNPGAAAAAAAHTRYCADHSCSFRACPNARPLTSLQFCTAHKCGVAACQDLAKNAVPALGLGLGLGPGDAPLLQARLMLLLLAGGGSGGSVGNKFCAAHSCLGDGGKCGAQVVGSDGGDGGGVGDGDGNGNGNGNGTLGSSRHRRRRAGNEAKHLFCQRHECSRWGCRTEATHQHRRGDGRGGMCDRHYRRRREEEGGGGVMGIPPMGIPPMGMMPGYPPFFGGGIVGSEYESSDESSEDEDGRMPRGRFPFGGPFF